MPKLTPERAAAQRRRVLEAALGCFAQAGFHATSMQDIVSASGLSPGGIYGYFKSKTEIVLAIARERHDMEAARIGDALAGGSFAESVTLLIERFVLTLQAPQERAWRDVAIQLWAESLRDAEVRGIAVEGNDGPVAALAQLIERSDAAPAGIAPHALAQVLVACLQGLALQSRWNPDMDLAACANALRALLAVANPLPEGEGGAGGAG